MDSQGPEKIGEILSRLFAARGWGRKQDRLRLERAWPTRLAPILRPQTRVAGIKRKRPGSGSERRRAVAGTAQFHKRRLLEALRKMLPGATVTDLRFRAPARGRNDFDP